MDPGQAPPDSQCLWFDYYRGSLYPLDLEAAPNCGIEPTSALSLVDLCCSYIVKDASLTSTAIDTVPTILQVNLMQAALRGNHDRSIHKLLSRWSFQGLTLSRLMPSVFTSLRPLYESDYQSDLVKQGLRYTTALAHTFLECLRQAEPTKIRRLDITGFPAAEVILYYLCSHCMLAHNERRRNNMVSLYNQAIQLTQEFQGTVASSHSTLESHFQNCLPEDVSCLMKLDAFVTSESCHSELCKALTVSSFPETKLRIIIERLSITCLGGERVLLLLKQLNPDEICGIQLKYNSLESDHLLMMAPTLQTFYRLTALDISCNMLQLQDFNLADVFKQILSSLNSLRRLDLSNNRVKNKLGIILQGLNSPLQQLRLDACGLSQSDMTALASCEQLRKLEELDLSENTLNHSCISLATLIGNNSPTLKLLKLEDNRIGDEEIFCLRNSFTQLSCLLFFSLASNLLNSETILKLVEDISCLGSLKVLKIPFSLECYGDDEEDFEEMDRLKTQVYSLFQSSQRNTKDIVKALFVPLYA